MVLGCGCCSSTILFVQRHSSIVMIDGRSVGCLDFVCASISNLVPGFWFANPLLPICSNVFHSHFRHHKFPFSIPKPIQMLPIVAFVVPSAWIHFYEWFGMSHSHHHWLASQCATIATAFFPFFHNALMFFHHKHCSHTPHSFCSILCRWMRTPSAHNNNSNRSGRKRTRETRAIVHYILCWINVVHCSAEQEKKWEEEKPTAIKMISSKLFPNIKIYCNTQKKPKEFAGSPLFLHSIKRFFVGVKNPWPIQYLGKRTFIWFAQSG